MSSGYDDRDRDRYDGDDDRDRYDDDRDADRPDARRSDPAELIELARRKVTLPAVFILLNGLLGLLLWVGLCGLTISNPLWQVDLARQFVAGQPPGQQKQEMEDKLQELEDQIKADQDRQVRTVLGQGVFLILTNLIAVVGAIRMWGVRNHVLSIIGSVASLVPFLTGCCCTGIPFGLWGLIVLLNSDVKAGFAANARGATGPPDGY